MEYIGGCAWIKLDLEGLKGIRGYLIHFHLFDPQAKILNVLKSDFFHFLHRRRKFWKIHD